MKRILIFGASGLLGWSLSRHLASDANVIRAGRSASLDLRVNLDSLASTRDCIEEARPDVIINLVALTDVDRCEREPDEAFRSNVRTLQTLTQAAALHTPEAHLIHVSTDQLYDGSGLSQESDVVIRNYYALSKYASELIALSVGATVVRTNFFGYSAHRARQSFTDWIFAKLTAGETINSFSDVYFSPVSFATLAAGFRSIVDNPVPGIFNVGSKDGMTKAEFISRFADALDLSQADIRRTNVSNVGLQARRPRDMRMSVSKFEQMFRMELPTLQSEINKVAEDYAIPAKAQH